MGLAQARRVGHPAEFVVGDLNGGYHAWVVFQQEGQHYLMETVSKTRELISPVEKVQTSYKPTFGVDHHFITYRYEEKNGHS